jgi:hypothetical protein
MSTSRPRPQPTDLGRFGNHWPSRSGGQFESPYTGPSPANARLLPLTRPRVARNADSSGSSRRRRFLIARNTLSVRRPRATAFSSSNRFSTSPRQVHRQQPVNSQSATASSCLVEFPSAGDWHRHRHRAGHPIATDPGLTVVSSWCLRATHVQLGFGPGPPVGRRHRGNGDLTDDMPYRLLKAISHPCCTARGRSPGREARAQADRG